MVTLNQLKETVYHELGHVIVYILSNKNADTYLGNIRLIVIGEFQNYISPDQNLYYYKLTEPNNHIYENSKKIRRSICWIILQISGCLFESHYDNTDFGKLFCSKYGCNGKKDFDNLLHFRHKSSFKITDDYISKLIIVFTELLEVHNVFEKTNDYLENFLKIHGDSNHFPFDNENLEILLNEMKEKIVSTDLETDFKILIDQEEKTLLKINY